MSDYEQSSAIVKPRSKAFVSVLFLAIIYILVNVLATPPRTTLERYHISPTTLHVIDTTFVVPVAVIWFIALYGYQKLRAYSNYVASNEKEGKHIVLLTRGIMVLTFWLPISSTTSSVLSLWAKHHMSLLPVTTIFINYLTLLFPLVAFILISRAARGLSDISKQRPTPLGTNIMAAVLIIAGVMYGYLVANAHGTIYMIYHMPTLAVLLTLVSPYIFSWFLGLLAAYELHLYTKKVRGVIYRKSWNSLALGVGWLIILSIAFQYLTTVSAKLINLPLGWILTLLYTLLPLMAVGYIFVAIGAKRLTKIEEV